MFEPFFLSEFKTILTGSSFLGLRSSVFVLYPPGMEALVEVDVEAGGIEALVEFS